jgi:hypothetical protein
MTLLEITLLLFVVLEVMNVLTMYFNPGSKRGNGIGVFTGFDSSKGSDEVHELVKYLVYWVAGTKLIFIGLILVIVFFATDQVQLYSAIVLIITISSYYWKLYPTMKKLDDQRFIQPTGYAKTLRSMITIIIFLLSLATIYSMIF